jgi:hypothetical protein
MLEKPQLELGEVVDMQRIREYAAVIQGLVRA